MTSACPCGRDRAYADCCGRFHAGAAAPTAEDLMRSRYSAFVVGNVGYLERTWASQTRPGDVRLVPDQAWTGLVILDTQAGGLLEPTGIVEFEASYERAGHHGSHHERSTFIREDGRWVYLGTVG